MLFKMSESNITETLMNNEIGRTLRWESRGTKKEGDQLLAKGQDMGPLATKLDDGDNTSEITYFGISIPSDVNVNGTEDMLHVYTDKIEALKIVKKFKKARFKAFKSRQDAVEFAVHGYEITASTSVLGDSSESTSPVVGEKPSPFKGPKAQDLVRLRKVIECGDLASFKIIVWANPRYLVSSGDTPAILQEGSRYNALHVAAKAKNAEICDLILRTVSDVTFVQLLYGEEDVASCRDRVDILVDLYLNTPDKALNETPLHFAVKFGAVAVAETLLSYPQCDKSVRNKFGQTPRDVMCSRVSSPDAALRHELASLLDDRFYVPVLRSEDNALQPTVGEPFSPACPLVLNVNPINPRMEIRAYAGPMAQDEASKFRKKWKTPPRMLRTPLKNVMQNCSDMRLQDTEKGLERVGRDLAKEFKVGWNEYWPFLDTFTNLASREGLQKLEAYLRKRYHDALEEPCRDQAFFLTSQSGADEVLSPMSDLCLAFKACSLSDNNVGKSYCARNKTARFTSTSDVSEEEAFLNVVPNPGLSPFLYVEKSCQVFAKRIADGLCVVGRSGRFVDSVADMLRAEVRHLQDLIYSFRDDPRFISVDFNLVHSRISTIVASKLAELHAEDLDFITTGLKSSVLPSRLLETSFSDEEDNVANYRGGQKKHDGERGQVRCLAEHILSALEEPRDCAGLHHIRTEEECISVWRDAAECVCLRQNFVRNTRKASSFKRNVPRYVPNNLTRRLTYDPITDGSTRTHLQAPQQETEEEDDEFYTPPSSPEVVSRCTTPDSEDDMATPDEGVNVYISGDLPSRQDLAVLQAIEAATISPFEFPNIYRWRHSVLLHSEQDRAGWQSPSSRLRERARTPERSRWEQVVSSTPPQPWHKITGPYSPLSPQL